MFQDTDVQPMLPVEDLKAAERFYEEILKLRKSTVRQPVTRVG